MLTFAASLATLATLANQGAWAALPDPVAFGAAIEVGNLDAARRWLDEGLDPDSEASRIGTGLMIAAWEGNLPMMELFLARGAAIDKTNRHGEQALQLAAWRGHLEAVRWLLDHGATVNREGKAWSALHYAVFAGHQEVARLLMARGAAVNARAPNDASVLMMAAREGREDLAKTLLEAGADPRLTNDRGDSALTWAMRHGNFRIAKLVSSAEAFAQAVEAPPENFGSAIKSTPAPSEIDALLEQLRQAEASGLPTAPVRQALMAAIERFRETSQPLPAAKGKKRPKSGQAPTLRITASRKGGGERAQVVSAATARDVAATTPAQRPVVPMVYEDTHVEKLRTLMQRLEAAQQAGEATAELRRAVREAYQKMKSTERSGTMKQ